MKYEEKIPFTASAKVLEAMVIDYFSQQDPMKMSMDDLAEEIEEITDLGNRILSIGLQAYSRVEYLYGTLQARNSLVSSMSDGIGRTNNP